MTCEMSQAMEFLHEFHKIPSTQPNNTHIYAMKKSVGQGLWIPRLQSTLYYQRLWQSEVDADVAALDGVPALAGVAHVFYELANLNACFERCANEAMANTRAVRTVRYDTGDRSCRCFDVSLFDWTFDALDATQNGLWHIRRESTAQWYEVKFCEFVRPDTSGHTLIWSKNLQLPGQSDGWCSGSPAGAGYVIKSGSVLDSYANGQSSAVRFIAPSLALRAALIILCIVSRLYSHSTSSARSSAKRIATATTPTCSSRRLKR